MADAGAGVELHQLRREQDYVAARKQYDQAAELGKRIEAKGRGSKKLVEDWEQGGPPAVPRSRRNTWRRSSRALTGIPVNELTVEEREKLLHLEQRLHERTVGQRRGGPCRGRCRAAVPRRPA